jgi:hypothetical protein
MYPHQAWTFLTETEIYCSQHSFLLHFLQFHTLISIYNLVTQNNFEYCLENFIFITFYTFKPHNVNILGRVLIFSVL